MKTNKLQNCVICIVLTMLATSSQLMAETGQSVAHKHGDRGHTHPLPNTGLNHNHNKGGNKSTAKSQKTKKWVYVASSERNKTYYHAKQGSLIISKSKVSVIGKINNKLRDTVILEKWSVPINNCHKEMGKISWYKISGEYIGASDFVFDSGNIASAIAKKICNSL